MTEPRVAPTAKIPDDAPLPAMRATPLPSAYANGPVSYAPPTMPPRVIPPTPIAVATPPPQIARVPEASLSIPTARPRTGLIATILVIDLALAGSGAFLLAKGLDHPAPVPPPPPAAVASPPAPIAAPAPPPPPVVQPTLGSAGSAAGSASAAGSGSAAPVHATAVPHAATAPVRHVPGPQDPYDADHLLDNEVEYDVARAAPDFERCLESALREAPVHGAIRIAFIVATDGHVERATAAQNTTGSIALAGCLATTISTWHFENHPAHPTSFVRPFSYP